MGVAINESHLQFATDHHNYSALLLGIIGQIGFSQNSQQFTILHLKFGNRSTFFDPTFLYYPNCCVEDSLLCCNKIANNIKYLHATQKMLCNVPYLRTDLNVHLYSYLWLFHQIIRSFKCRLVKPSTEFMWAGWGWRPLNLVWENSLEMRLWRETWLWWAEIVTSSSKTECYKTWLL